jgi:hypothetical protein
MTGRSPRLAVRFVLLALGAGGLILGAGGLAGCAREPVLARGPFTVGTVASTVPFERAVPARSDHWVICLEFEKPDDSRQASALHVGLVDELGRRCPLRVLHVDRRGERRVALEGRIDCGASTAGAGRDAAPWVAIVWASPTPVQVRSLSGADLD